MEPTESLDLLVEIGTEELPPKALNTLATGLEEGIKTGLRKAQITFGSAQRYASPRRLAVYISKVASVQPERRSERRGPALATAFDENGNPSKAAEGFARSCGVSVEQLQKQETDKGAWLMFVSVQPGQPSSSLIPTIVEEALHALPIPRPMRWADRNDEFVRPVQWVLLLFGNHALKATILGVESAASTRGHRFHHPEPIIVESACDYARILKDRGYVIVDFHERSAIIAKQVNELAHDVGGTAIITDELLSEVTALVEWPVALLGNFDERFLAVPAEVLITTMQEKQRYFPIRDRNAERLLPCFITIANIESKDPQQIQRGNERVIRPRFSDAEFFWNQDLKTPLADQLPSLKQVIYQQQLGSLYDKSIRVSKLAGFIAESIAGNRQWAERAGLLGKCDLLSQMVQEFPELQGTMGRYYAWHHHEPDEVARAIEEQYLPRYAGDSLPRTSTGQAMALADKLDTLLGFFSIGQVPSGAKDPFALRRAANGVLRILIECRLDLDLLTLLDYAAKGYAVDQSAHTAIPVLFDFILERQRAYYMDQGISSDTFDAVFARKPSRPLDFDRRIQAVASFRKLPEASSLTAANKRIRNILKKSDQVALGTSIEWMLLREPAERALAECLRTISATLQSLFDAGQYGPAMTQLTTLREPVDRFFDSIMVNVEDIPLRNNRLALLTELENLFLRVADFSCIQI
ncbi:MAG: glycine--tRNA ligase subunit beta [Gammaproteobacteria bacterium]